MMNCCNCYRTDGKRNDCYYHIPAMAAYSKERVAAIVVRVLYRMLTKEEHKPELSQEDVMALDSMIRQLD